MTNQEQYELICEKAKDSGFIRFFVRGEEEEE